MKTCAVFGEILLRLSPPPGERLLQSPVLSARFGGAEANVAVSLARFGRAVRCITVLPIGPLGDAAAGELRRFGVDTSFIIRREGRMGLYFAEGGAAQRPSQVVYDRENSALALIAPGAVEWPKALEDAGRFHMTGITPALSARAAEAALEAVKTARTKGLEISLDLNFRANLWTYGKTVLDVMPEFVRQADLLIANEEDCQKCLGIEAAVVPGRDALDPRVYEDLTARVMNRFPNLGRLAVTLRRSRSASDNNWTAVMRTSARFFPGPDYDIRGIVDRIGAGDAFAAGLIHGLDTLDDDRAALAFAVAASCLKHTIAGDFNLADESEVLRLMRGDRSGRIRR